MIPKQRNCIAKKSMVAGRKAPKLPKQPQDSQKIKKLDGNIIEATMMRRITGYSGLAAAQADANQLLHPDAFQYRSALFPNPKAFGVEARIVDTKPVEVDPRGLKPYCVTLIIEVKGPSEAVLNWRSRLDERLRTYMIL